MVQIINKQELQQVQKIFGFLLAQELAKAAPKDTGTMARSFPSTYTFKNDKISFVTPYYTKYIEFGTSKITPRAFIRDTIHRHGNRLLKQAFKIVDSQKIR